MSLVDNEHDLPEGLGFRLALDMQAMKNFVNLSDEGKKQMMEYIKRSTSGEQAKNRVTEVVTNLHKGESFK